MSKEDAEIEVKKGNYVKEYPGKGFRRVIAAPKPIDIVEIDAIRALVNADQEVIACGGGGIPVIEQKGALKGASAVIEKDAIAGKLASDLGTDELIILTNVDYVYKNYGTDTQEPIRSMTVEPVSYTHLAAGSPSSTSITSRILLGADSVPSPVTQVT